MKYKIGDRVVIKPWLLMEKQYGLTSGGNIASLVGFMHNQEKALQGTDRVLSIGEESGDRYFCGGFPSSISDDHILGYAFAYGEEIEVSDDGDNWFKRTFSSYRPGCVNLIGTTTSVNMHARPIQAPVIEVTCKVNGEDKPLSFLSEETLLKIRGGK